MKASLLQNNLNNPNHWLGLTLLTPKDGTSIIGTKITLSTADLKLLRIYQPATGYLSYSDPRIHFGIGANHKIDQVKIEWPDGEVEIIKNVPSDQYISIAKGTGQVAR